jgi:hypothetical protein
MRVLIDVPSMSNLAVVHVMAVLHPKCSVAAGFLLGAAEYNLFKNKACKLLVVM